MSASKKMFCIGWKADESKFSGEKGILRTVAADLAAEIIAGVSSDFYNRIYDKGLVNKSFCFSPCIYRTHAVTVCEGEADEPEKVLKEIGDEIAERIERGIGEAEFAREKNAYIGNLVKVCNNPAGLGSLLSSLYSMNTDLFDYFDCCAKIKCDDVKESFGILFSGRPVLSVVEPL